LHRVGGSPPPPFGAVLETRAPRGRLKTALSGRLDRRGTALPLYAEGGASVTSQSATEAVEMIEDRHPAFD